MTNIITQFWKGEIKLWKTYWLLGIIPLVWILPIEIYFTDDDFKIKGISLMIEMAFEVFWFVSVWRAANKYLGKIYWYYASKLSAIISIIFTIFDIFKFSGLL